MCLNALMPTTTGVASSAAVILNYSSDRHFAAPPAIAVIVCQYIPEFLDQEDFAAVLASAKQLSPQLRKELNCIAANRMGCYVPDDDVITAVFSSNAVAQVLQQVGIQV